MLSDRNYMGNPIRNSIRRQQNGVKTVFILIVINVIVFLLVKDNSPLYDAMKLNSMGLKELKLWQLVTSMFLHGNFWHLFFNMYGLYLFGTTVATKLGSNKFLALYFLSGVLGNLLWIAFNWGTTIYIPQLGISFPISIIGASGGVFGILMAAAMLYPDMMIMLILPPIPMKMKTFVVVYGALEVFFELSRIEGGVAHLAHLGGLLGAYFYIKHLYPRDIWDPLAAIFSNTPKMKRPKQDTSGWTVHKFDDKDEHYDPDKQVSQRELDRILDKISATGINSLTKNEEAKLKKAREQMKGR